VAVDVDGEDKVDVVEGDGVDVEDMGGVDIVMGGVDRDVEGEAGLLTVGVGDATGDGTELFLALFFLALSGSCSKVG
jgi:hypothetical protein